jgi:hypothetical protein
VGVQTPRSARVNGRIRKMTIRPAPECAGAVPGAADPVSRNRPPVGSSSTARRTRSHATGSRCHSSIRMGYGPSPSRRGSAASSCACAGSSNRVFDRAAELAGAAGNVAGLLEHEGY